MTTKPSTTPYSTTPSTTPYSTTPSTTPYITTPSTTPYITTPSTTPYSTTPSTTPYITIPDTSTTPDITMPSIYQENINLQNTIITLLTDLLSRTKDALTIKESFKDSSKIENFSNMIENLPDVQAYTNIYNKSIALADDPNNYNQIAFDTYMNIQNNKIKKLQKNLDDIKNQIGEQKTPPIKAIKNMSNSQILNLETYPDPTAANNGQPSTYPGNGSPKYPNYLIYGNQGCLQYNPASSSTAGAPLNSTPANWNFVSCNASDPTQQFYINQIKNKDDFNAPIKNPNNANYKINSTNSTLLGFNVVNPRNASDQCLQANSDGLSVMPCTMQYTQRFKPMYRTAKE